MDNNINIKFVGYSDAGTMKNALNHRTYTVNLETFYNAVNQDSSGCCSYCKQETHKLYCIQPVSLPIKHTALSMCYECLKSLPIELTVINIDSNGSPPLLIDRQYESEV
jgi:hypothetical protein